MKEKQNLVITIGRQYGSGGRIVGKALAEELGIHFYDEEILTMTSEPSAVGEVFFRPAMMQDSWSASSRITSDWKRNRFSGFTISPSVDGFPSCGFIPLTIL